MNVLDKIFGEWRYTSTEITRGASTRKYYRVMGPPCERYKVDSLIMACYTGYSKPGFSQFIEIHKILEKTGLLVPSLYKIWRKHFAIAMEDIGDLSLEVLCKKADEKQMVDYYKSVIDDLIRIHEINVDKYRVFKLPFDRGEEEVFVQEIYIYDLKVYVQKYLLQDHFGWEYFDRGLIDSFFHSVCDELFPYIKSVMYRDFQSSNIFYNSNKDQFCYLDFQDARMGVPHYDLASLLWDSYVLLKPEIKKHLLQYYLKKRRLDASDFIKPYEFCVIQRKWHDAGAFAHAYKVTGKEHFLKYIKPAVKNALDVMRRYSEFSKIAFYFEERLWGRF